MLSFFILFSAELFNAKQNKKDHATPTGFVRPVELPAIRHDLYSCAGGFPLPSSPSPAAEGRAMRADSSAIAALIRLRH